MTPALTARLAPLLPALLVIAGLACLVVAAFTLALWAGWAAAGVACLALEYVLTGGGTPGQRAGG